MCARGASGAARLILTAVWTWPPRGAGQERGLPSRNFNADPAVPMSPIRRRIAERLVEAARANGAGVEDGEPPVLSNEGHVRVAADDE